MLPVRIELAAYLRRGLGSHGASVVIQSDAAARGRVSQQHHRSLAAVLDPQTLHRRLAAAHATEAQRVAYSVLQRLGSYGHALRSRARGLVGLRAEFVSAAKDAYAALMKDGECAAFLRALDDALRL